MRIRSIKDLEKISKEFRKRLYYPDGIKVNIGMSLCGIGAGAKATLEKAKKEFQGDDGIEICQTGCLGYCKEEPLVEIFGNGKPRVIYRNITADKIAKAIKGYMDGDFDNKWILGQMRDPRSLLEDELENPLAEIAPVEGIPFLEDLPFYKKQVKVALRNCGYIDPDSVEEYIARGGYFAFFRALSELAPKEIIKLVK